MMDELTDVEKIYYAAVGDNGIAAFAYRTSRALKSSLRRLYKRMQEMQDDYHFEDISLVFGPGKGFVMCWPTLDNAYWGSLINQESIGEDINSLDFVRHVALGVDGDYIILHSSGVQYSVENYPMLESIIDDKSPSENITLQFVALNPWKANEFLLIVDNDTAFFALNSSLEAVVAENLRELDITCNSLIRHNPTRTVAAPRNINNKKFLDGVMDHIVGGAVSGIVGTVVQGIASCTVM
ncbi:hypothetical protein QQX98_008928 [Neonectria punicea]|uniref:Uncharacterized protein n=1 Tax=Neonectria punicea TaxID=979145 RepID=A0ABR1GTQ4_9HYPO